MGDVQDGLSASPRPLTPDDAGDAAALGALSLPESWSADAIATLLESGQGIGWKIGGTDLHAFLLARVIGDEAEILTLVVAGPARRRGHARRLLVEALAHFRTRHVRQVFLELRASNAAAQALYRHCGFAPNGLRRGYYASPAGREDAVTMQRNLYAVTA